MIIEKNWKMEKHNELAHIIQYNAEQFDKFGILDCSTAGPAW